MDLQQKLDIAVQLLEHSISMEEIRFGTEDELDLIARRRAFINLADLKTFAEEVANRSTRQAQQKERERGLRSRFTILVTDDESCLTKEMHSDTCLVQDLSDEISFLDSGFQVEFRVRNKILADRCSRILNRKVEATNEPLLSLKEGDRVMILPRWQIERGADQQVTVNHQRYVSAEHPHRS